MRTSSTISALLLTALVLIACATATRISKVKIGMSKEEVIVVMGKPVSVSAQGRAEYLNYSLSETDDQAWYGITRPYYVRLIDGRVESFGRAGDFDSTKTPAVRIESDQTIRQDIRVKDSGDLYTELKKLKDLKDSGVITDEEFEARKKKLLEKY